MGNELQELVCDFRAWIFIEIKIGGYLVSWVVDIY